MTGLAGDEQHPTAAQRKLARALARAFLAGELTTAGLREGGVRALGRTWPWLGALAAETLRHFGKDLDAAHHDEIVGFIVAFRPFRAAFETAGPHPEVRGRFPFHERMTSAPPALARIALPRLDTPGDLAHWLGISPAELDWFADIAGRDARQSVEALRHYRCRWLSKADGGARLLEVPKLRLRAIQRHILREILDRIPPHPAAHGCVARRSPLTNALPHAGHALLLRLDLGDFFAGISAARVHALFRTLGYAPATVRHLAGLTTHGVSRCVVRSVPTVESASPEQRRLAMERATRLTARHLPQGAPTSAAIANLCAYRLDLRLAAAAKASGASYTRYVDDMFFSFDGGSPGRVRRFAQMACTIIVEEGFTPNTRKTRISSRARAQYVTGLVVNAYPNVPRHEYDRLKAVLSNCIRHGPAAQNRDSHPDFRAHLLGRVSRVLHANPARGLKLRALLDAIEWERQRDPTHLGSASFLS